MDTLDTMKPDAREICGPRASNGAASNAMSVDVEEHFQVSAMESKISRDRWDSLESRVERNVDSILAIFAANGVTATFFMLGWVAERHPGMVHRIVAGGHELASHGYRHVRVNRQTTEEFRDDVTRTKGILEEIAGVPVRGYRAASFSIDGSTPWAHSVLADTGHSYSSSIYPIRHDHYGVPDAPRFAYRPLRGSDFLEIPITTVCLAQRRIPCGGGGYFRLLPYELSLWGMNRVRVRDDRPCVFYFHPWEVDPAQPRVPGLSRRTRFRHYVGLSTMQQRLERLTRALRWERMDRVFQIPHGQGMVA